MSSAPQTRPLPAPTHRASAPIVDKRHRLRKRRVNTPLLAASVATVVVATISGYFWHRHRERQVYGALKVRAQALAEQGNWRPAATYWQRYLWIAPNDFAARLGMIDAIERTAVTPRDRQRLSVVLHEAIGLAPADQQAELHDLQVRIVENQLEMGDFSGAYAAAGEQLQNAGVPPALPPASDHAARLLRARALAGATLARDRGQIAIADAAKDLVDAAAQFPGDQRLASMAAVFYRRYGGTHAEEIGDALGKPFDQKAAEATADKLIDDFVAARKNHPDALVARCLYQLQFGLPNAGADIAEALRQNPAHYDALLCSATIESKRNPEAAHAALDKAIKANPTDVRGHFYQAQLDLSLGDLAAAEKSLRQAESASGAPNSTVESLLARVLIQAGKLTEADTTLLQLSSTIETQLPQLTVASRRTLQAQLQLLRAQRVEAGGDLPQAIQLLNAIVAAAGSVENIRNSTEILEARTLLAELMERVGHWELATRYWGELATVSLETDDYRQPAEKAALVAEATRRAATAALAAGQPDRSIQWLDAYFHPPVAPSGQLAWAPQPIARVVAAKAHLQKQLALTPEQRNWDEFREALDHAKALVPPLVDTCFAEFEYIRAIATEMSNGQALKVLKTGEQQFAVDPSFWRAAAFGYQSLEQNGDAQRALARYDELEPNVARRAEVRAVLLARNGKLDDADRALADAATDASGSDLLELQRLRITLLNSGAPDRAFQLAEQCLAKLPQAPQLLAAGIEAALKARQFTAAERWEQAFAEADPLNDFLIDRFRAARLLEQFEQLSEPQRDQLQDVIVRLRASRPNFAATTVLAARLADLQGNRRQAIDEYQLAVSQGAADTAFTERLARLLYAEGRYEEADKYLARLAAVDQSSPVVESLSIESALGRNDVAEATRRARQAADDHPEDPVRQILLAKLLSHNKQPGEARKVLQAACEKSPTDARVWHTFFSLLIETKQVEDARALLTRFRAALGEDSVDMHFISAQVYQALGDPEHAMIEAQAAIKLDADNFLCRLLLVKLLMSADVVRATAECEAILADKKLPLKDAVRGEVRRQLAVLLSSSGKEADALRAMKLLEDAAQDGTSPGAAADNRLRALLLSRQGRNVAERAKNLSAARQIIAALVEQQGAAAEDVDRRLLANLYEQEALLSSQPSLYLAARKQLQRLLNRESAPVNYKLEYTDFLLRQLARTNPKDDPAADKENESLREVFTRDAQDRIVDLEADAAKSTAPIEVLQLVGCRARLLHATGQEAQALRAIDEFADQRLAAVETEAGKARAWLVLASLYSAVGQHEKAESWYRRLMEISPESYVLVAQELIAQGRADEAVDTCLDAASSTERDIARAATALAGLLASGSVGTQGVARVEPVIAAALQSHADNVDLLMAVAVLNVTQDNAAQAIEYFERVVKIAPDNIVALNNLATLLAEQPTRRSEALELIQRAIDAGGRQAALLDTLGTIEMLAGKASQAVTSLEEAVASGGGDPRYYFHLAAAYHRANRPDEARAALIRARELGLDKAILTGGDEQLLRDLDHQLGAAAQAPPLESRRRSPRDSHSASFGAQSAQMAA